MKRFIAFWSIFIYSIVGFVICAQQDTEFMISNSVNIRKAPQNHTDAQICEGETYLWNGKTYYDSGEYSETITNQDGTTVTVTLSLSISPFPDLTVRPDTAVEAGEELELWTKGADFVSWEPANLVTKTAEQRFFASPAQSTLYTITASTKVESRNLVYNGSFEDGNVGFTTDFMFFRPYSPENVVFWGYYTITDKTQGFRWPSSALGYGGGGNMLLADGYDYPGATVWEQMVNVEPYTFYAFSAQVMSCYISNSHNSYALLQFLVNNQQIGPVFHSPSELYEWVQFYDIWYSGEAVEATLTIKNLNEDGVGNDFGIDDIRFEPMSCSISEDVLVLVWQHSTADTAVCQNQLPFTWNTKHIAEQGVYVDTIVSSTGYRDSIVTLNVTAYPSYDGIIDRQTITEGQTYDWEGDAYSVSGYYNKKLTTIHGCDSAVTLRLDVIEKTKKTREIIADICEGDGYDFYGEIMTEEGMYQKKIEYADYDSVITLRLFVHPVEYDDEYANIYEGQTVTWNGEIYDAPGNYTIRQQTEYGCDKFVTLHITLLEKTVRTRQVSAVICDNQTYTFYGETYNSTITVTHEEHYAEYDSIVTLDLTVNPSYSDIIDEQTIDYGDSYTWEGDTYSKSGDYTKTLTTKDGCDSIVTLRLNVEKTYVYPLVENISISNQCADNQQLDVELLQSGGAIERMEISFSGRDKGYGFAPQSIMMPQEHNIVTHSARAGDYTAHVDCYFDNEVVYTADIKFTLYYPSAVLEQAWNDVMVVLTQEYNGGYDFIAFQWFEDGRMLEGQTDSYIYQPLRMGAEYSALLTEVDGTQLMTCPLVATEQTDITLYPTLLTKGQRVKCYVREDAYFVVYNSIGQVIETGNIDNGWSEISVPQNEGIYVIKIVVSADKERTYKIMVR